MYRFFGRWMACVLALARCACVVLVGVTSAAAFQEVDAVRIANGFARPTYACAPLGDAQRIFVTEKNTGLIWIVENGTVLGTPFLDLGAKISTTGERGLHGMAFHPDYDSNGLFYVAYSSSAGPSLVESYTVSAGDPNVADPSSASIVVGPVDQPGDFHHGGCVQFGPDGMLYVGIGDGDDHTTAQDGNELRGKLLRLDVDAPFPHIPPDNPFLGNPGVRDEIWAIGFRAPWRFSFDALTGDLYIGDVGKADREEISFEPAGSGGGRNYGWACKEGTKCTGLGGAGCSCSDPQLIDPIEEYSHSIGCAIIGGYVYRGCAVPALQGSYLYADFCTGRIYSFEFDGVNKSPTIDRTDDLDPPPQHVNINQVSSFAVDGLGELLIVDYQEGELFRVVPQAPYADCNGNLLPDECDIELGLSCDVDGNGVPDECDGGAPVVYCTAKTNSCGSLPAIATSGVPSAAASSGFEIRGEKARGLRAGLPFYGNSGRAAIPFDGGFLCLQPPLRRAVVSSSGGTSGLCDGVLSIDMNAFAAGALGGNPQPFLRMPGTRIHVQWWARDTVANGSYLSDAVEYVLCP